jgi:two-component system response regulator QseB
MRILLLEDDQDIGDGLSAGLRKQGFLVDWLQDGREGAQALTAAPYDAVILDLGLPGMDGMDVLADWRRHGHTLPVLILTARDALPDRIAGLNGGADDYLCKPFALAEVVARLHALSRRYLGQAQSLLHHGALTLDTAAFTASFEGETIALSKREWLLLHLLVTHPGQVFSRSQIEDKLYSWDQEVESNAVEVYIHHLRKKIYPELIQTRRGIGYQLGSLP